MVRSHVRGVVFDLDGVLVHSTECHRAAFEEVLRPFGITDFEYARYAGWRTQEVFVEEFRRSDLAVSAETIRDAAARKTLLARQKMLEINPVAADCLTVLAGLSESYLLALASSGSSGSVQAFLEVNGCRKFFRSVLTGDDIVHAKPDPEIYRKSFAALELPANDCVVVEDAVAGIDAARRAGATAIGITGTCTAGTLLAAGAAHVVEALSGLRELLPAL
jgi:beta-phosphoglucomutase